MKVRLIIFSALISGAVILGGCADNATDAEDIKPMDSPVVDSAMPAHVQDPSTAFPQPPVTGTLVDSTRSKDSADKK